MLTGKKMLPPPRITRQKRSSKPLGNAIGTRRNEDQNSILREFEEAGVVIRSGTINKPSADNAGELCRGISQLPKFGYAG
jgi:hypothetical protein